MNALTRGLAWPIVSLLIIGSSHLLAEMVRPALQTIFIPPVTMPVLLVIGGWTGVAVVRAGGTLIHGLLGAAVIGLFPVVLQLVGFGVILGRTWDTVVTTALYSFLAVFWGGAIGSGVATSLGLSRVTATETAAVTEAAEVRAMAAPARA
jgi:hypothetical protein